MQIPTKQFADSQLAAMSRVQRELQDIQAKLSTGRSLLHASDDPSKSMEINRIDNEAADLARRRSALEFTNVRLGLEEEMLAQVISVVQRAKELAILGNRDTSASDRAALTAEARQIKDVMLNLANTSDESGQSLFAGFLSSAPAYVLDPDTGDVRYQGDTGLAVVPGSDGTVEGVRSGAGLFEGVRSAQGLVDAFTIIDSLAETLDAAGSLATVQQDLESLAEHFSVRMTSLGFKRADLDRRLEQFPGRALLLAARREPLANADIAALTTRLQQGIASLQAAQLSFVKTMDLNLFKFLS